MVLMSDSGFLFLLRWIHFLAGITWIGLLYYLNFAQTPFFAETDAPVRSGIQQKLLGRVMWWFRWGAMITFLSGWIYLLHYWIEKRGINDPGTWVILLGGILGSIMWFNVWFVIWPVQKLVIQNALDMAAGKPANPAIAPRAGRAGLASRTNVVFSIPLLFLMGAASHLPMPRPASGGAFWLIVLIITALVEANCLTMAPAKPTTKALGTVKGTLWFGFILTLVYYLLFEVMKAGG
jgi:Urate oxidase N-terminal